MEAGTDPMDTLSYPTWRDLADNDVVDLAFWMFAPIALSSDQRPDVVLGFTTSPSYFSVLGLQPSLGRFYTPEEADPADAAALAVISHALWERRFALDPAVIGTTIRINGTATTVVGVGPAGFQGHISALSADVWVPLGMIAPGLPDRDDLDGRTSAFLLGVGRAEARCRRGPRAIDAGSGDGGHRWPIRSSKASPWAWRLSEASRHSSVSWRRSSCRS